MVLSHFEAVVVVPLSYHECPLLLFLPSRASQDVPGLLLQFHSILQRSPQHTDQVVTHAVLEAQVFAICKLVQDHLALYLIHAMSRPCLRILTLFHVARQSSLSGSTSDSLSLSAVTDPRGILN